MFHWFDKLSVQVKLLLCFAIIVVVGITAIALNLINIDAINQSAQDIAANNTATRNLSDAQISFLFQELAAKDFLLTGDDSYIDEADSSSAAVGGFLDAASENAPASSQAQFDELRELQQTYLDAYNTMVDQVKADTDLTAMFISIDKADSAGIDFDNRVDELVVANKDAVDAELQNANAIATRAVWISIITMALFTGLGAIIFLVARQLVEPIRAITTAVTQLETGKFEPSSLDKVAKRRDQLGKLAELFQKMAREVASREAALKAQVEELKIQIDVAKQSQQVSEITDSDFFVELQNKSKALKRGKQEGGSAPAK